MVLVLEAIEYEYHFIEYRFAEYRFAEYRFAEYRFAEWLKRKRPTYPFESFDQPSPARI